MLQLLRLNRGKMRRSVLALAMLVFAAPLAAKPAVNPGDPQTLYRTGSIASCTRRLGEVEGANADEVEQLCSCAADRFIGGRDGAALPAPDPAGMPQGMGTEVLRCLPEVRPDAAGALAAEAMRLPALAPPSSAEIPAASAPDKPAPAAPSGPGVWDRLTSFADRLTSLGLPRWAWGLIALLGILVLRRLFGRAGRDDNLMGPPRPARYRNLPRY